MTNAGTNPLCSLLGIQHPIIQAPMAGGPVTPALVAAVSNAGGLGSLPAARMPIERLREQIRLVKELTDRPFAVNLLIPAPVQTDQSLDAAQGVLDEVRRELDLPPGPRQLTPPSFTAMDSLEAALAEGVQVISVGLGSPAPLMDRISSVGVVSIAMVTCVAEAKEVAALGISAIVAQGLEAGGHRSTFGIGPVDPYPLIGTMALVPEIVDTVNVPVIAAGGIMDRRGVLAALALGAAGVQLGTRFLTAREAGTAAAYRERILRASASDTVLTTAFSGRPTRALRNRLIDQVEASGQPPLAWPNQALAADDIVSAALSRGLADWFPMQVGQGVSRLIADQPAAEIVAELSRGVLSAEC